VKLICPDNPTYENTEEKVNPDFRTICRFRRENADFLKQVFKETVKLASKYKSVESIIKFVIEAGGMPYITILPLSLFISLVTPYIIRIFFKRRKYFEEIFMMIFILNMGIGFFYI